VDQTLSAFPEGWQPDAVVGALGTQIRIGDQVVRDWPNRFRAWDRKPIDTVMAELGHEPHPPSVQTPYKASFHVPPHRRHETLLAVRAAGLNSRVVVSGPSNFDIIPPTAGKAAAAHHLAQRLGVGPFNRMIVAGDSGNDLDMFRLNAKGIAVGNARDELIAGVDAERTYMAQLSRAAGVVEGLHAWGAMSGGGADESEPSARSGKWNGNGHSSESHHKRDGVLSAPAEG
jgi:hypothetical protein